MSRRRRIVGIAAAALVAGVIAPAVYFGAILDFEGYVQELRQDRARSASASRLRPSGSRSLLTSEEVEEVAHAFGARGLLDPRSQVLAPLQYWAMRDADGYDAGIERLAVRRGFGARVIVALNWWRIDDVRRADMERRRPGAEAQLAVLDEDQRRTLDNVWEEHGFELLGGMPRIDEALRPARIRAEHRRLAEALARTPPEKRTAEGLADGLAVLRRAGGRGAEELESTRCTLAVELDLESGARLLLACPSDDGESVTARPIDFPDAVVPAPGEAPSAP